MQQRRSAKNLRQRTLSCLVLLVTLGILAPGLLPRVWADEMVAAPTVQKELQPLFLLALADAPDFLAPPPREVTPEKEKEKGKETAITPFIGTSQALTLLPTPERPAIAASDVPVLDRSEVTAGVNVNLGTIKFNLGYTLPSGQVDEFVRPFGVELEPGKDVKRFSLGVKIPF